jgi:hypothetical protein
MFRCNALLSLLTVMRSVFEGGEGVIRGGKSERSSDSGVVAGEDRLLEMVEVVFKGGNLLRGDSMVELSFSDCNGTLLV